MSVRDAINRELESAVHERLVVRQIRITPDAIAGSVTLAPMTPERLQAWAAIIGEVATWFNVPHSMIGAPEARERWREVLVHPADWEALQAEVGDRNGHASRAWGLPVAR